jgi:type I restriction enzyme, S subunit
MTRTIKLGSLIEKSHIKNADFSSDKDLEPFGVSNVDGITRTAHRKSDDLGEYLIIEPKSFAYNPYRINVGSIGLTPEDTTGVVSPAYIVFKAKDSIIPEILLDFLKSKEGLRQINKLASGGVRKALRYDQLCEIDFPNISYEQQLAIFKSKKYFNERYSQLCFEVATQEEYLPQLRQVILEKAMRGDLTSSWRSENKSQKKIQLSKYTPTNLPYDLPETWSSSYLGDVSQLIGGGSFLSSDFGKGKGVKCIKITNAGVRELVETDDILPIGFEKQYKKNQVHAGDLILALTRPYISNGLKVCICPPSYDGALLNQRVAGIRVNKKILTTEFAFLFMRSDIVLKTYKAEFDEKGQQPNLKNDHVKKLIIPLPPLEEQMEIVKEVLRLEGMVDKFVVELNSIKKNIEMLNNAILSKAFSISNLN